MKFTDALRRVFLPKSPMQANGMPQQGTVGDADYRLDLTLQNLLALGSEYTPDDIINLRRRARYGDPRWLYSLYDEMMRLGPSAQVLKAREMIKATETVWTAMPEEADENAESSDAEDKAARLIRDVTEEAWSKWIPDLKAHLSTKFFYGMAAVQVMWNPRAIEGKWSRVTDIRPVPARRFRLEPETLRFKILTNPYTWEGPYVDDLQREGKLIFVETGADVEPLDQRGAFFQCLLPWAIQQFNVRWRAKRLQNFGMPPVMVTYPKGDPQNRATAIDLAELLSSGTRAAIPEGMKAELLASAGGGRGGDPYETAIEWCERQYDKIILGHSQASGVQVGAGSKTSSKTADQQSREVTNSRAEEIDNDLYQQAWTPYVAREFGQDHADMNTPRTRSTVFEADDPEMLSTVALNLAQAGAAGVISAEDLVERCSLDVAQDGQLTLAGNVKGEHPAPAEVDAFTKANPTPAGTMIGPDGKPMSKPALPPRSDGKGGMLPGAPGASRMLPAPGTAPPAQAGNALGRPNARPGATAPAPPGKGEGGPVPPPPGAAGKPPAAGAGKFMGMGDVAAPARSSVVRRGRNGKGRAPRRRFYASRHRFTADAEWAQITDEIKNGPPPVAEVVPIRLVGASVPTREGDVTGAYDVEPERETFDAHKPRLLGRSKRLLAVEARMAARVKKHLDAQKKAELAHTPDHDEIAKG